LCIGLVLKAANKPKKLLYLPNRKKK